MLYPLHPRSKLAISPLLSLLFVVGMSACERKVKAPSIEASSPASVALAAQTAVALPTTSPTTTPVPQTFLLPVFGPGMSQKQHSSTVSAVMQGKTATIDAAFLPKTTPQANGPIELRCGKTSHPGSLVSFQTQVGGRVVLQTKIVFQLESSILADCKVHVARKPPPTGMKRR